MSRIFADTSYWIALLNPRDDLHNRALIASEKHSDSVLITSEMVLVEFVNSFNESGSRLRKAVVTAVHALRQSEQVIVMPQTSTQFEGALLLYQQVIDKDWSLTDCASFQIMHAEQIDAALTHDRHFQQAGFVALLR